MTRTLTIHEKIEENRSFKANEKLRSGIFIMGIANIATKCKDLYKDKDIDISIFMPSENQMYRLYKLTTLILRKQVKFNRNFKYNKQ